MLRSDSESVAWGNNRRSSYYGGGSRQLPRTQGRAALTFAGTDGNGGRFSHDSYYGSRPPSMMYGARPDGANSQHDLRQPGGGQRDGHHEPFQGPGNSHGPPPPNQGRRGYPRMASEPPPFAPGYRQQGPGDYTIPNNHRSYETVASTSGSGSSAEPLGYQTDPTSSDNSSVERMQAAQKPQQSQQPLNDYGIGFSQNSTYQPPAFTVGYQGAGPGREPNGQPPHGGPAGFGGSRPPPVPAKGPAPILRKPTAEQIQQRPSPPEKRKSWFTRRFSKNG